MWLRPSWRNTVLHSRKKKLLLFPPPSPHLVDAGHDGENGRVGDDGGLNVAAGQAERHLLTLWRRRRRKKKSLEPRRVCVRLCFFHRRLNTANLEGRGGLDHDDVELALCCRLFQKRIHRLRAAKGHDHLLPKKGGQEVQKKKKQEKKKKPESKGRGPVHK